MDKRFWIENIESGQEVSGMINISVQIMDALMKEQALDLFINDKLWGGFWVDQESPPYTTTIPLITHYLANGLHTLSVRDSGRYTTTIQSDTQTVEVKNSLSEFHNDGTFQPLLGASCHIRAQLTPPQSWQVKILAANWVDIEKRDGTLRYDEVRSFQGHGAELDMAWDATDGQGQKVPLDLYHLVVTALETGEVFQTTITATQNLVPY